MSQLIAGFLHLKVSFFFYGSLVRLLLVVVFVSVVSIEYWVRDQGRDDNKPINRFLITANLLSLDYGKKLIRRQSPCNFGVGQRWSCQGEVPFLIKIAHSLKIKSFPLPNLFNVLELFFPMSRDIRWRAWKSGRREAILMLDKLLKALTQ